MLNTHQDFKEKRIKELEALKERGTRKTSLPLDGESFDIDEALEFYKALPPKNESWEDFTVRMKLGDKPLEVPTLMWWSSVFVYEQSLNWRRQVMKFKALADAIPKKVEVDEDPEESRNP